MADRKRRPSAANTFSSMEINGIVRHFERFPTRDHAAANALLKFRRMQEKMAAKATGDKYAIDVAGRAIEGLSKEDRAKALSALNAMFGGAT